MNRMNLRMTEATKWARLRGALPIAAAAAAIAACDTDVQNPGPVQDPILDQPESQPALVNGMGRALSEGLNWLSYTGAAVTREIHPAGSTGSFGITPRWQRGELAEDDRDLDTHWELASTARWLAEHGITRIEGTGPETPELHALAYLYAGYANRNLGQHYCEAVIDGEGLQPHTVFFTRAEAAFTMAAEIGTDELATAALAGRASVRASLGDWAGAGADAALVPDAFVYRLDYHDVGSDAQRNRIQWATASTPYRAHTQWNTVYEAYYEQTGDPRIQWRMTTEVGDAAIDCCGNVPWYPQEKYLTPGEDITLSSGSEMRLVEAEALLRNNDLAGAMAKINALRTAAGVPSVNAASITDGWTALKRERGIVLWLEGRRMGDLRRWLVEGTPGALDPLELPSGRDRKSVV